MATLPQIQTVPELIGQHLGSSVLNHVLLGFGILQLWLISPLVSADEIVKCRSRTGQLIYSDAPCENFFGIAGAPKSIMDAVTLFQ